VPTRRPIILSLAFAALSPALPACRESPAPAGAASTSSAAAAAASARKPEDPPWGVVHEVTAETVSDNCTPALPTGVLGKEVAVFHYLRPGKGLTDERPALLAASLVVHDKVRAEVRLTGNRPPFVTKHVADEGYELPGTGTCIDAPDVTYRVTDLQGNDIRAVRVVAWPAPKACEGPTKRPPLPAGAPAKACRVEQQLRLKALYELRCPPGTAFPGRGVLTTPPGESAPPPPAPGEMPKWCNRARGDAAAAAAERDGG
jgi:hypothetical protein